MSSQGIHEYGLPGKLRLMSFTSHFSFLFFYKIVYYCHIQAQSTLIIPTFSQQNLFPRTSGVCDDHTTYDKRLLNTVHQTHVEKLQSYCVPCRNTNHKHLLLVGDANTYSSSSFLTFIILFKYLRITVAVVTMNGTVLNPVLLFPWYWVKKGSYVRD